MLFTKTPIAMFAKAYFSSPFRATRLIAGCLIIVICCAGCRLGRMVEAPLDSIGVRTPGWGQGLAAGMVAGLDTSRVDSLVERLVRLSAQTLRDELDAVQLDALEQELNGSLRRILRDNLDLLKADLTDPATFDTLQLRLRPMLAELAVAMDRALRNAVPNALNDQSLGRIYRLRDSLLGPSTALLLEDIINQNVERALTNPKIDELIIKIRDLSKTTTGDIQQTARGINRTVLLLGGALALLLILTIVLIVVLRRKQAKAEQQEELLVNITKGIDAIPEQEAYDMTVGHIREQLTRRSADPELIALLDRILEEHQAEYPGKRKYRAYYQRLLQLVRQADPSGSVKQRVLSDIGSDQDFAGFAEKALGGVAAD